MDLDKKIKAAIEESMPKQVGDILRARLDQADRLEEEVKKLEDKNKVSNNFITEQGVVLKELSSRTHLQSVLEEKEKELSERENKLAIRLLEVELNAEKDKSAFAFNVAMGLVRNTEFRKVLSDSVLKPHIMDANGTLHAQNTYQNSTETKTTE